MIEEGSRIQLNGEGTPGTVLQSVPPSNVALVKYDDDTTEWQPLDQLTEEVYDGSDRVTMNELAAERPHLADGFRQIQEEARGRITK
jgi:hypothetical protein